MENIQNPIITTSHTNTRITRILKFIYLGICLLFIIGICGLLWWLYVKTIPKLPKLPNSTLQKPDPECMMAVGNSCCSGLRLPNGECECCQNGRCTVIGGIRRCVCQPGWKGRFCDECDHDYGILGCSNQPTIALQPISSSWESI